MTDTVERAAQTPISDHVARFWEILRIENVYIALNIRRDHENGPPHFDTAQFGEDVAKALVAERGMRASPATALSPPVQPVSDEPVAWLCVGLGVDDDGEGWARDLITRNPKFVADLIGFANWTVTPLYTRPQPAKEAVEALTYLETNQRQLDMDGVEVGVSREALDKLITAYRSLASLSQEQG